MTCILKTWDELRKRKNHMFPYNSLGLWSQHVRRSHSCRFFSLDHRFHYLEIMVFFQQKKKLIRNWNPLSTRVVRNVCIFFSLFCVLHCWSHLKCLLFVFLWSKFYCFVNSSQLIAPETKSLLPICRMKPQQEAASFVTSPQMWNFFASALI